jgi:cytochrome c
MWIRSGLTGVPVHRPNRQFRSRWQPSLAVAVVLFLSACSGEVNGVPEPRTASAEQIDAGRRLIASYGCGSCHAIPGVPGADAMAGPPLSQFYQRSYIAGRLPNTEENLVKWIQDPQRIEPGTAMPNLGVTEDEARTIAAYLYHQPALTDRIDP